MKKNKLIENDLEFDGDLITMMFIEGKQTFQALKQFDSIYTHYTSLDTQNKRKKELCKRNR